MNASMHLNTIALARHGCDRRRVVLRLACQCNLLVHACVCSSFEVILPSRMTALAARFVGSVTLKHASEKKGGLFRREPKQPPFFERSHVCPENKQLCSPRPTLKACEREKGKGRLSDEASFGVRTQTSLLILFSHPVILKKGVVPPQTLNMSWMDYTTTRGDNSWSMARFHAFSDRYLEPVRSFA